MKTKLILLFAELCLTLFYTVAFIIGQVMRKATGFSWFFFDTSLSDKFIPFQILIIIAFAILKSISKMNTFSKKIKMQILPYIDDMYQ
jgi:hypothetical protein